MSRKIDLEDNLGEISSLAHTVRLAAESLKEPKDRNAMTYMMDLIAERLNAARDIIDDLEEVQA